MWRGVSRKPQTGHARPFRLLEATVKLTVLGIISVHFRRKGGEKIAQDSEVVYERCPKKVRDLFFKRFSG